MLQNWNGFNPQIAQMIAQRYQQPQQQQQGQGFSSMLPLILMMMRKGQSSGRNPMGGGMPGMMPQMTGALPLQQSPTFNVG